MIQPAPVPAAQRERGCGEPTRSDGVRRRPRPEAGTTRPHALGVRQAPGRVLGGEHCIGVRHMPSQPHEREKGRKKQGGCSQCPARFPPGWSHPSNARRPDGRVRPAQPPPPTASPLVTEANPRPASPHTPLAPSRAIPPTRASDPYPHHLTPTHLKSLGHSGRRCHQLRATQRLSAVDARCGSRITSCPKSARRTEVPPELSLDSPRSAVRRCRLLTPHTHGAARTPRPPRRPKGTGCCLRKETPLRTSPRSRPCRSGAPAAAPRPLTTGTPGAVPGTCRPAR